MKFRDFKKTAVIVSAVSAFAAGAAAAVFAVKKLVKEETGHSLEEILTENEISPDVQEIISAVEVAAEAAPIIGDTVAEIQRANAAKEADAAAEETPEVPTEESPAE